MTHSNAFTSSTSQAARSPEPVAAARGPSKTQLQVHQERCQLIRQVTQRGESLVPEFWTPEHIAEVKEAQACGEEWCRVFVGVPHHWSKERGDLLFEFAVNDEDLAELIERVDLELLSAKKGNWSAAGQFSFMGTEVMTLTWNRIWLEGVPALELLINVMDAPGESTYEHPTITISWVPPMHQKKRQMKRR